MASEGEAAAGRVASGMVGDTAGVGEGAEVGDGAGVGVEVAWTAAGVGVGTGLEVRTAFFWADHDEPDASNRTADKPNPNHHLARVHMGFSCRNHDLRRREIRSRGPQPEFIRRLRSGRARPSQERQQIMLVGYAAL